jgi:hypothetical protein
MNKISQVLNSKTAWTTVLLVLVNVVPALPFDESLKNLLNVVLGALVVYFRVSATNVPEKPL